MYSNHLSENTELIKLINYKRMIRSPNKFKKALKVYSNLNSKLNIDLSIDNIRNYIPAFDVGGYFIDNDDNVCLIYDTYETENNHPYFFTRMLSIPDSAVTYISVKQGLNDPPNFYSIHRPHCYIIRISM